MAFIQCQTNQLTLIRETMDICIGLFWHPFNVLFQEIAPLLDFMTGACQTTCPALSMFTNVPLPKKYQVISNHQVCSTMINVIRIIFHNAHFALQSIHSVKLMSNQEVGNPLGSSLLAASYASYSNGDNLVNT